MCLFNAMNACFSDNDCEECQHDDNDHVGVAYDAVGCSSVRGCISRQLKSIETSCIFIEIEFTIFNYYYFFPRSLSKYISREFVRCRFFLLQLSRFWLHFGTIVISVKNYHQSFHYIYIHFD